MTINKTQQVSKEEEDFRNEQWWQQVGPEQQDVWPARQVCGSGLPGLGPAWTLGSPRLYHSPLQVSIRCAPQHVALPVIS